MITQLGQRFRLAREFPRIEATGGHYTDLADPLFLEVLITLSSSADTIIEAGHVKDGVESLKAPFRLQHGIWGFDMTPGLYTPGISYTAHWRHSMQPGVLRVVRDSFTWTRVRERARAPEDCMLFGTVTYPGGVPAPNVTLVIEQYDNFLSMTNRTGSITVVSDAFGNWSADVPRESIQRVVYGEASKVIKIPDADRASVALLPSYSPADGLKDRFGYPFPDVR